MTPELKDKIEKIKKLETTIIRISKHLGLNELAQLEKLTEAQKLELEFRDAQLSELKTIAERMLLFLILNNQNIAELLRECDDDQRKIELTQDLQNADQLIITYTEWKNKIRNIVA